MLSGKRIGIIGCGNMGQALLRGILSKRLVRKKDLVFYEQDIKRSSFIKKKFRIKSADSSGRLVSETDVIILAIKPQDMNELLVELSRAFSPGQVLISIAAGVTIQRIKRFIKADIPIVRVMPNSPALIGQAISAISYSASIKNSHCLIARSIFNSLGETIEVKEGLMDAVTAVSGSGPAYFFLIVEYLSRVARKMGLDQETAFKLASQTALGSAKLLVEGSDAPEVLIKKVASKGGTTEAALAVFKKMKLEHIFTRAVKAAAKRSKELSGD